MTAPSADALWTRLREAGLAQGDAPAEEPQAPWFVRLMLGIAGWIGALFLFGFFGVALQEMLRSAGARTFLGALLCGLVAVLFRAARPGELVQQFGLALGLAGQALLASGLAEALRSSAAAAAAVVAAQQAILFFAVPGVVHRVWCAASAGTALAFALGQWDCGAYAMPLLSAGFVVASLREMDKARQLQLLRAAGYGLGIAACLAVILQGRGLDLFWGRAIPVPSHGQWGASALVGLVVLAGAAALLRREGVPLASGSGLLGMAGAAIVAAAAAKAPGIAPASALVVLGYANGNRVLTGLGIAALLAYLSYYYYSLQATLLEKSMLLAIAGLALLVARLGMQRVVPESPDA